MSPSSSSLAPVLCGPAPAPRQLAAHRRAYYCFIHFTVNTFTDKEWGYGDESPAIFNPTALDPRQWARVARDAGMTALILTCKHHDGFCLWPSAYTEHSVKHSPWKHGQGDVVREAADACREFGLEFGVYLSPWDRNHARYGHPEYITYYRNQLRELLTNYGPICEVWFDGANGGDGYYGGAREKRVIDTATYYDWPETHRLVRALQPLAIMFSDAGPDIRWVGNESGLGSETTWCTLNMAGRYPGYADISELGCGQEGGSDWLPPETDVSIRPGWFYHAHEDHLVRSPANLLELYHQSVGRGTTLLLNLPPDRRGLIHETDVANLLTLRQALDRIFAHDLAPGATASASNVRGQVPQFAAARATDGDRETYWVADDGVTSATLELRFPQPITATTVRLQEHIQLGQRVQRWRLEAAPASGSAATAPWTVLARGTTIGYERLARFAPVQTSAVRLVIEAARACPTLQTFGLYQSPVLLQEPQFARRPSGHVTLSAGSTGARIRYTLDGSAPTPQSPIYTAPLALPRGGTVAAAVFPADHPGAFALGACNVVTRRFGLAKGQWRIVSSSHGGHPELAIDEDPATHWHTPWQGEVAPLPHEFVIDLGQVEPLTAFSYLPRQDHWREGNVERYALYASTDGSTWGAPVVTGRFDNIAASNAEQVVPFPAPTPVAARYVKFVALTSVRERSWANCAELGLFV